MKISDLFRRKKSYTMPVFLAPVATFPNRDFYSYAQIGYSRNVYVRACVDLIARSVAGIDWGLFRKTKNGLEEIDDHPLIRLWEKPNPNQGRSGFLEMLVKYLELSGNSFVLGVGPENKKTILEMYVLRPDLVTPQTSETGEVVAYEYWENQKIKRIYSPEQVMHIKLFSPLNPVLGSSPLEAAFNSLIQNNSAREWNVALLQNFARPAGAFVVPVNEYSSGRLSDEDYERLKTRINEMMGSKAAGRPLVLEGGLDWKEMGLTADEIDWLEGLKLTAREIALAFNVPPELIGDNANKTYSNYQEARRSFYEECILPLMDLIKDELNRWLVPKFGPDLYLDYDRDDIEALAEDRDKLWARVGAASWLTPNEKRIATGYDEIQDRNANQLFLPINLMPIGSSSDEIIKAHPLEIGLKAFKKEDKRDFFTPASSSSGAGKGQSKRK